MPIETNFTQTLKLILKKFRNDTCILEVDARRGQEFCRSVDSILLYM
jgi:hypothetical protein